MKSQQIEDYVGDSPSFNAVGRIRRAPAVSVSSSGGHKDDTYRPYATSASAAAVRTDGPAHHQPVSPSLPSAFQQLDLLSRPSRSPLINMASKGPIKPQTGDSNQADRYIESLFFTSNEDSKGSPTVRKGWSDSPPQGYSTSISPNLTFHHSGVRKTNSGNKFAEISALAAASSPETKGSTSGKKSMDIFFKAFSRFFSNSPTRQTKKDDSSDRATADTDWMRLLSDKPKSVAAPLASSSEFLNPHRLHHHQSSRKQTAVLLLFCTILIVYIIVQSSMGMRLERKVALDFRKQGDTKSEYIGRAAKLHEEGMDRPNSVEYIRMVQRQRMAPQRVVGGVLDPVQQQTTRIDGKYQQHHSMTGLGALATQEVDGASREQFLQKQRHQQSTNGLHGQNTDSVTLPHSFNQDTSGKVSLPAYNNIADVNTRLKQGETPVFWHIPRGGGGSYKEIFGQCMGLTLGCELGSDPKHAADSELKLFDIDGKKVVNIDMYKPPGIEKARKLELVSSGLVDVIISPYLHQVSTLFSSHHKGRIFAVFRDPIERAVSIYGFQEHLFLKENPGKTFMTLEEYAKSSKIENNWMTRFVTNRLAGPLSPPDLQSAKNILRAKCLIGLLDRKEESMQRFNNYFGWNTLKVDTRHAEMRQQCIQKNLEGAPSHRKFSSQIVEQGSKIHTLLTAQNVYDIELYLYARELFDMQSSLFS